MSVMDCLILFCFLIGLALAAPRWGYDSRDGLRSDEQELACLQFNWRDLAAR